MPLALLPLACAGCFDMHGRGDPELDAGRDGGPSDPWDATVPWDAVVPWDAWTTPADAGACFAITDDRATSACLRRDGSGVVPPGVAYDLAIRLEGCFCAHRLRCEVRVLDPFALELTTSVCDEGADCDGCVDGIETTCTLPPLPEGTWHVTVNGSDAFDLPVEVPTPGLVGVDLCWDFAPTREGGSLLCPWPGTTLSSGGAMDAACHVAEARPTERVAIEIVDACADCFQQWGACRVEISGSAIRVSPAELACDCPPCGGCVDVCMREERACHLPTLSPGDYEVFVDGTSGPTPLHVGETAPTPSPTICAPGA